MSIFNIDLFFLDYIVIALSALIIFFSLWKGFINSILGFLTWVGSVFITIYTYELFSNYLNDLLLNLEFLSGFEQPISILSIIISIPIIFLLSLFIFKRIRGLLSRDLDKQIFGMIIDKLFGAFYGILFSYVIFSTLIYFTENDNFILINTFLIDNSNLLNIISEYNNNIIELYFGDSETIIEMD